MVKRYKLIQNTIALLICTFFSSIPLNCNTVSCLNFSGNYRLSGCQREGSCQITLENCSAKLSCNNFIDSCLGSGIDRELDLQCTRYDGQSMRGIGDISEDKIQLLLFIEKKSCRITLTKR